MLVRNATTNTKYLMDATQRHTSRYRTFTTHQSVVETLDRFIIFVLVLVRIFILDALVVVCGNSVQIIQAFDRIEIVLKRGTKRVSTGSTERPFEVVLPFCRFFFPCPGAIAWLCHSRSSSVSQMLRLLRHLSNYWLCQYSAFRFLCPDRRTETDWKCHWGFRINWKGGALTGFSVFTSALMAAAPAEATGSIAETLFVRSPLASTVTSLKIRKFWISDLL